MAKPKVTRIKASESSVKVEEEQSPITRKKVVVDDKKQAAVKRKEIRKAEKLAKKQARAAENKKVFILFRPFVALFRYLRDAWREIRQVRWPSRKDTWKMVVAVLAYTALFVIIISLLDLFFKWLFGLILG